MLIKEAMADGLQLTAVMQLLPVVEIIIAIALGYKIGCVLFQRIRQRNASINDRDS